MRAVRLCKWCVLLSLSTSAFIALSVLLYRNYKVTVRFFEVYYSPDLYELLESGNCSQTPIEQGQLPESDFSTLVDLRGFRFRLNSVGCNRSHPPHLLVLVHSAPGNLQKRRQIRATWGSVVQGSLLFVLGEVDSRDLQSQLELEYAQYQDLVQGTFRDAYRNMTYKHVTSLKWVHYFCPSASYILKTDDDTFINTPALLRILPNRCLLSRLILCHLWVRVPVQRKAYKWTVSRSEFEADVFPNYCSGTAILYSRDAALALYSAAQWAPYFWVDDVHVTGVLAASLNLTQLPARGRMQPIRLSYNETILCSRRAPFVFSRHNMSDTAMSMLWEYVLKC